MIADPVAGGGQEVLATGVEDLLDHVVELGPALLDHPPDEGREPRPELRAVGHPVDDGVSDGAGALRTFLLAEGLVGPGRPSLLPSFVGIPADPLEVVAPRLE